MYIQIYLFHETKNGTKSVMHFFKRNNIIFKVQIPFHEKEKRKGKKYKYKHSLKVLKGRKKDDKSR